MIVILSAHPARIPAARAPAIILATTVIVSLCWLSVPRSIIGQAAAQEAGDTAPASVGASRVALDRQRTELEGLKKQLDSARREATLLRGQEEKVMRQLESVDKQVNVLERYLTKLGTQATALAERLGQLDQEIQSREQELNDSRERLSYRIRQMHKTGQLSIVEIIFTSESLPDLFRRVDLMARLADEERKLMGSIQTVRIELVGAQKEIEQRRYEVQLVQEE